MKVAKGTVTASTSNGATSVVDLSAVFSAGEPLRGIIVWAAYNTVAGTVADARFSLGFGTNDGGSIQQGGGAAYWKGSGVAATDIADAINTTWILRGFSNATPTLDYEIDLTAFSDTGFTLTYTDAPASAIIIHYFAFGGSDVAKARVGSVGLTTGTGAQDVTVAASWGQPNLVFGLQTGPQSALSDGRVPGNGAGIVFGVAKSDTVRQASAFQTRDAQNSADSRLWQKQRFMVGLNNGVATTEWDLGAVAGFPTDGFEINKVVHPAATTQLIYMAVQGTFASAIGTDLALTAGSTDDIAAGCTPAGALAWGGNIPATAGSINSNHAELGQFIIGGTDGTNEGCASFMDDDANLNPVTYSHHSASKFLEYYTPVTPTLRAQADSSFDGNNLRLTWTDLDTIATEFNYLILGTRAPSLVYQPTAQRNYLLRR